MATLTARNPSMAPFSIEAIDIIRTPTEFVTVAEADFCDIRIRYRWPAHGDWHAAGKAIIKALGLLNGRINWTAELSAHHVNGNPVEQMGTIWGKMSLHSAECVVMDDYLLRMIHPGRTPSPTRPDPFHRTTMAEMKAEEKVRQERRKKGA